MYYLDVMIFSYPQSVTFTVVYIFTFECDDMFTEFYFNLIYFVISDIFLKFVWLVGLNGL